VSHLENNSLPFSGGSQIGLANAVSRPIGYGNCHLGLNNQKIALFGLFYRAYENRVPVVLPDIEIFDATGMTSGRFAFDRVFYIDNIRKFAGTYGIEIASANSPYDDVNGWASFEIGARRLPIDASRGETVLNEFMGQFFRCLRPSIVDTELFQKLYTAIFKDSGVIVTSQLRIEKDWITYSKTDLHNLEGSGEDYLPSFQRIIEKIKNSLPDQLKLYIVCDEANLPATKDEIRQEVYQRFGTYLLWKSDILSRDELASLSVLDLSLIDFEMSVASPAFIGITRSTFSMMACFEAFTRRKTFVLNHFIYDNAGDYLARRFDHGSANSPDKATNKMLRRERLIAESPDDCHWPISLTAHISNVGDFTSSAHSLIGVKGTPIVCGVRADELKLIEGFELRAISQLPCVIEYRVRNVDGWTNWVPVGSFAGSKEQNKTLSGFAIRLRGDMSRQFSCIYAGAFKGHVALVGGADGQDCVGQGGAALEVMQIVIRPALS
jgi:hypothetical protein